MKEVIEDFGDGLETVVDFPTDVELIVALARLKQQRNAIFFIDPTTLKIRKLDFPNINIAKDIAERWFI